MAGTVKQEYNTYLTGTAREVTECLEIILYNKDILTASDNVEKINTYNIHNIIQELYACKKYVKLERESPDNLFEYTKSPIISGFNILIYLGENGEGLGYTEFINLQGKYRDLRIGIEITTTIDNTLSIDITSSLVLANRVGSREFIGEDLGDYTSGLKLSQWKSNPESNVCPGAYTTHLTALKRNSIVGESSMWLGGMGIVRNGDEHITALSLARDFDPDPYNLEFPNHYFGLYSPSDICYYNWEGLKYSIFSLSTTNKFGTPIKHTDRYDEVIGISGYEIMGFAGKYAVLSDGNDKTALWDTSEMKLVQPIENSGKIFVDETNPNYRFVSIPSVSYITNVTDLIPDVTNTFYDVEYYGSRNSINIIYRRGKWFVFRRGNNLIWTNLRQSITTTWEERGRVFLINDLYLGIFSPDRTSIVLYMGLGENWMSEQAKGLEDYTDAFSDGRLRKCEGAISDTDLMIFRRRAFPSGGYPEVKDIVGAVMGIIYYKTEEGKLDYI